jgi:hypothetical protein
MAPFLFSCMSGLKTMVKAGVAPKTIKHTISRYVPVNKTYEWMWSLSNIVNSLIRNGLKIEILNDWWILKKYKGMIPLTFTLRARKQR